MRNLLIRLRALLESVPYTLLALPLRVGGGAVFWLSGTTKLDNWDSALQLFRDEYRVPVFPPDFAAHLALGVELSAPVLLVLD